MIVLCTTLALNSSYNILFVENVPHIHAFTLPKESRSVSVRAAGGADGAADVEAALCTALESRAAGTVRHCARGVQAIVFRCSPRTISFEIDEMQEVSRSHVADVHF